MKEEEETMALLSLVAAVAFVGTSCMETGARDTCRTSLFLPFLLLPEPFSILFITESLSADHDDARGDSECAFDNQNLRTGKEDVVEPG